MKATNQLAPQKTKQAFSTAIMGDTLQNLIRKCVSSTEAASRLSGTLVSAVAANQQLQSCNPASIVAAALRGEGMNLTYGIDYHLVPYGDKCQYIIGYKGLLHLLIATGEVADTNCIPVLEGEYKGRNKKTKRPEFDFSVYSTPEEEARKKIVGYYFYVELRNGYTASEYMRISDIVEHAQRYSRSFDIKIFDKLNDGGYTLQEAERIKEKSPWYGNFEIMASKTVIRRLLNSGFVPLANSASIRKALDEDGESGEGEIFNSDMLATPTEAVKQEEAVEAEYTEANDAGSENAEAEAELLAVNDAEEQKQPRRKAKEQQDAEINFFGEEEVQE